MEMRYQMMVETGANVSSSFVSYLVGTNLLNNDTLTEFSNLADSQDNYDYPVLASSLSAKEGLEKGADLTCLDVYGQNGPFEKGKNYGYGQSGDESSWFGGTTSFSVRELETLENESNVSLSYASYYETHPYWPSDQLGIFLNQSEGYVALAFHRV